jgi:hypothetical protein
MQLIFTFFPVDTTVFFSLDTGRRMCYALRCAAFSAKASSANASPQPNNGEFETILT